MKLKYQLFITLLVASALLIALMLAISSWSFNRGFLGYVNNAEEARLDPLISDLSTTYQQQGNWQWVNTNKETWRALLSENRVERRQGQIRIPPRDGHPPPPPRSKSKQRHRSESSSRDTERPGKPRPPRRPPGPSQWLVLADSDKTVLAGKISPQDTIKWLPIESDGEIVGYLGYKRHRQLNRRVDQVFAQQQKRSFGYAALGMALLSALLSIPLSSRIVKPLLTANKAVSEISHGNYSYRVDTRRTDEFGDLANNINSLGLTLEQNMTARQRWIAEISHELRTPLAVLQGEIEAMQDGIRKTDPESLHSLHTEVLQLSRLINDLHQLSLSDIGALDYQMHTLPLHDIVNSYLLSNTHALEEADLQLRFNQSPVSIFGDQQRIIQLLDNLLQNSIRYTHAGGTLDVMVEAQQQHAVLRWSDSAPGVADKDLQHLFDPLYRTEESRNRQYGGSGLGLAIVQKIVTAHDGTVEANHGTSGGLEIKISIPLRQG